MRIKVNGREKILKSGARLKDALAGENYHPGSVVSIHLSTEKLVMESDDFEIKMSSGKSIVLHLEPGKDSELWKKHMTNMPGLYTRWVNRQIAAIGAFPTDIKVNRDRRRYRKYDAFFALGGFDNNTTYIMIAREEHRGAYGAGSGIIGRVTLGRHVIDQMREGDKIESVTPLISETSKDNVIVTSDLSFKLEEGYSVDTFITVDLDRQSPKSAEHLLVLSRSGYMEVTESTGSFMASSLDLDTEIPQEINIVRSPGVVTVRNTGPGMGRMYIYRERRQMLPSHNHVGTVTNGLSIAMFAKAGDKIGVVTNPQRILSVGMTQKDGAAFLGSKGLRQKRTGDTSDEAVIVDQTPEATLDAIHSDKIETFGVPRDKIYKISLDRGEKNKLNSYYFEKMTGLSHKPIGALKVHFAFKGMPMVTFEGDEVRGKSLYPNDPFKKCSRGDIGVTNQARPHKGLLGIRLENSKEYGPTGEEPYGTNIFGKFLGDLDDMMQGLKDGDTVYFTEMDL